MVSHCGGIQHGSEHGMLGDELDYSAKIPCVNIMPSGHIISGEDSGSVLSVTANTRDKDVCPNKLHEQLGY